MSRFSARQDGIWGIQSIIVNATASHPVNTDCHHAVHCKVHISTVASYLHVEFWCIESRGRWIYDHAEGNLPSILSQFIFSNSIQGGMTPCPDDWDDLSLSTKEHVITQVTCHLMSIFELRFAHTGSLYQSSNGSYTVGPIMHAKYFKTIDGMPVYTDARVQHALHQFRGPFSDTADWLSSPMKAEIFALSSTPSPSPLCVGGHHHMIYHSLWRSRIKL
jgi:hypothetical protein